MLSCDCEFTNWYYNIPNRFTIYKNLRRKKCCSCGQMISFNDVCVKFNRYRNAHNDTEERIHKGEVPLAPYYMCEKCGGIYLNLSVLKFCLNIEKPMEEALREYWKLTGFEPMKEEKCKQ